MTPAEYDKEVEARLDAKEIPKEFRSALSRLAYQQGHSCGYEEVLVMLDDLIQALATPIQELIKRIKWESK